MRCRLCVGVLCAPVAVATIGFALLLVPSVEDAFSRAAFANLEGIPLTLAGAAIVVRHFTYCMGDYLGCVKQEFAEDMVNQYTYEVGVAQLVPFSWSMLSNGHTEIPVFFSHAAYRAWAHDPHAGRPRDMFVFSKKADLPPGVLPERSQDIMLNFDTGTAEHSARRTLLADALPALAFSQDSEIALPPGVQPSVVNEPISRIDNIVGGKLKKAVFDVVGYNLFLKLFGVDISEHLDAHFEYDGMLAPGVLGAPVTTWKGKRMASIRQAVSEKVKAGDVAKSFLARAAERDMDGEGRLDEMIWIAMFAGYGGTGNLAYETMKFVAKEPARFVPMFKLDPRAFMLEAARLHPPVGGMNPVTYRSNTTHKYANGVTRHMREGDMAVLLTSGSNMDPGVFEDPAAFRPGRKNAQKVLSWNNELSAFEKCPSVAGCPEAPRGCPGTWLSLRLATGAVQLFVDALATGAKTSGGEL